MTVENVVYWFRTPTFWVRPLMKLVIQDCAWSRRLKKWYNLSRRMWWSTTISNAADGSSKVRNVTSPRSSAARKSEMSRMTTHVSIVQLRQKSILLQVSDNLTTDQTFYNLWHEVQIWHPSENLYVCTKTNINPRYRRKYGLSYCDGYKVNCACAVSRDLCISGPQNHT